MLKGCWARPWVTARRRPDPPYAPREPHVPWTAVGDRPGERRQSSPRKAQGHDLQGRVSRGEAWGRLTDRGHSAP